MQKFSETETIAFRVDGNDQIGMGHVVRCLCIAKNLNSKVIFLTCEDRSYDAIVENGFECIKIDGTYNELFLELESILRLIQKLSINKFVVDTYYATQKYVENLSKITQTIILGSSKTIYSSASLLINYSCTYDENFYKKNYPNTKLLLGALYTPIRRDFIESKCEIRESIRCVVITTGGTQIKEMCLAIASEFLDKKEDIECQIIVSGNDEKIKKIEELAANHEKITVFKNISDMADRLSEADVLITAAGTTLYEACAVGVPTITFALVEEQVADGQKISELTNCLYAGSIEKDGKQKVVSKIMQSFEELSVRENRLEISEKMKMIVDGKGSIYIAKEIESL